MCAHLALDDLKLEDYMDNDIKTIELTLEEFELVYEAIRKPTTKFEREDVVDIVRTERKARLLEEIRHRVGLREAAPDDGEFQTS